MAQSTFTRPTLTRITTRYDRLARWYRFGEAAIVLPPGLRRKAVERLGLKSGDTVDLEVALQCSGCAGTTSRQARGVGGAT